jgi:hydrogenase expression/formation protein HypC
VCLAFPGKIVEKKSEMAVVDLQGNRMSVSTVLTPEADLHDWVLVHAGFAIAKIDEAEARETWSYLNAMNDMGENLEDGIGEAADG